MLAKEEQLISDNDAFVGWSLTGDKIRFVSQSGHRTTGSTLIANANGTGRVLSSMAVT